MVGRFVCAASVATVALSASAIAGEIPKTVDEVVAKYVEAVGGRKAMEAVKSVRFVGKTLIGSFESPITIEMVRPNKLRTEIDFQGMTLVTGFDGAIGWSIPPTGPDAVPERMSNEQQEAAMDQADLDGPLIDYKKKGHKLELIEDGSIEGAATIQMKLTRKGGAVEFFHIDKEHFLVLARTKRLALDGSFIEDARYFGQYKSVGGRLFAHSIENKRGGMTLGSVTFEKIEMNPEISDKRFEMPE